MNPTAPEEEPSFCWEGLTIRAAHRGVNRNAENPCSSDLITGSGLASHEAERLLGLVTGADRSAVVGGMAVDHALVSRFRGLVERRRAGEPLQYLEGTVQFGPIELEVDGRVLIPRPETEQLWERVMALLPAQPCRVVDIGTGSGCLALAIKHERPDVHVVATDVSSDALDLALGNAGRLMLDIEFREGDGLSALDPSIRGSVAAIVTNPPYVAEADWPGLSTDVREHEPKSALVMGDGLDMYRHLASDASRWLAPSGLLVAEIGELQGRAVTRLFRSNGWDATVERDWTGRDRFLVARIDR